MSILHKLGLYRLSEINEIIAWATEIDIKADKIAEKAKDTEECYKAMLTMYNEAQTPEHAVEVLKAYCAAQSECTTCNFHDGKCKLAHIPPGWWEVTK